jgi:transaldolase / glucose-6-phosphate isomerase
MEVPAVRAARLGQSMWYDNISRDLLDSGELARLIADHGVRGVTSNPTIFQKAMTTAKSYAAEFEKLARAGGSASEIYEAMAVSDIRRGADLLRGVYDASEGKDGFISLEVAPSLAHDTDGTLTEAKRLWAAVDRPNLMIKIPATPEGVPAVRAAIAAGMNVNITLIFSLASHASVIDAFMSGLEERVKRGQPIERIASVASFFVSRVDTAIDKQLDAKGSPAALALRGKAAIANAKLAYELFEREFGKPRFAALSGKGAQFQRPLWASTSTKNPSYKDTVYVDALIGPNTVDTLPPATLTAFNDHGTVAVTIRDGLDEAKRQLRELEAVGISMEKVCADLLREGVESFAKSFVDLIGAVETRRRELSA